MLNIRNHEVSPRVEAAWVETQEPPAPHKGAGIETEVPSTDEPELFCAKLLTPKDGILVPAVGVLTLSWEALDGAEKYILKF